MSRKVTATATNVASNNVMKTTAAPAAAIEPDSFESTRRVSMKARTFNTTLIAALLAVSGAAQARPWRR